MKYLLSLVLLFSLSYAGQIVVNKSAGITALSSADAKNVFNLKQLAWGNGTKIKVFLLPAAHEAEEKFASSVLGSSASAVYDKWVAYILNGGANKPPKTVNQRKMLKLLKKKEGAIGILPDGVAVPAGAVVVLKF